MRTAAETLPTNPALDAARVISTLAPGQALVTAPVQTVKEPFPIFESICLLILTGGIYWLWTTKYFWPVVIVLAFLLVRGFRIMRQ